MRISDWSSDVCSSDLSALRRVPLTASMFYLGAGAALGPTGAGLLQLDAVEDAAVLERVAEIAVIISLFTAGLKLRLPGRSEERRVGKECVSTCRSRWSPYH